MVVGKIKSMDRMREREGEMHQNQKSSREGGWILVVKAPRGIALRSMSVLISRWLVLRPFRGAEE